MPASTLDPVNSALRASLSKSNSENVLESQIAGSTKKALLANIEFESAGSYHSTVLDSLKSKYIVLKSPESVKESSKPELDSGLDESLKLPKYELFSMESVQLGWSEYGDWSAGCGMINMGNTCYLNSTLQALFHIPALVNWLMSDKEHSSGCFESGGLCIICAVRKTLLESQNSSLNAIRPLHIYNKLRFICRNFILGRQEDAHEFLRHLVEAMEKAYLSRFRNHDQLDSKVKETTPLNQIFGGYLRSAVHCLECGHVSTTFQHFQDLLLDIRKSQTVEEALEGYFSREKLDDESYQCESCRKKVAATKQFSVERAPMALCVQLKRFSVSNTKITKHISFRQRLDMTKYARSRPSTPLVYKLVSLVTHMGPTVNCGHYTAVGLAPSGNFYQFDDSTVRPISYQGVFSTNAYILMYELESSPYAQKSSSSSTTCSSSSISKSSQISSSLSSKSSSSVDQQQINCSTSSSSSENSKTKKVSSVIVNGYGYTSGKVYGPELPPPPPPTLHNNNNKTVANGSVFAANGNKRDRSSSSDSDSSDSNSEMKENTSSDNNNVVNNNNKNNNRPKESKNSDQLVPFATAAAPPPFENGKTSSGTSCCTNNNSNGASKQVPTIAKLVPYDAEDSSNSDDSNNDININNNRKNNNNNNNERDNNNKEGGTISSNGWNVSSQKSYEPSSTGKSWSGGKNGNNGRCQQQNVSGERCNGNNGKFQHVSSPASSSSTVQELFKMSHGGYSAPVSQWNGARARLDKEVANERREDRKRTHSELNDSEDQGRTKHVKSHNNGYKSNPGYNPVEEYHNAKNWGRNNQQRFFTRKYHGNRPRSNFHRKNYHKNFHFRQ